MCHNKVLQITLHVAPSTNSTHFGVKKGLINDISRIRHFILLMYYADVAAIIH